MTASQHKFCVGGLMALLLLSSSQALAQSTALVSCRASATKVGVGDTFTIKMDAMVQNGPVPNSPSLLAPSTFSISHPRVSSRTMAQMGGSSMYIQRGIGVTWRLRATHEGKFSIPAPTVNIAGKTVAATCELRIRVGAAGSGQSNDSDDDDERPDDDDLSTRGRRLALDEAPDRYAFVRIVADKTEVVVGEQVTLSFYFYRFGRYHQVGLPREPSLTDFLRFPLERAPGVGSSVTTRAGNRPFEARLIDKMAVFPVRSGALKIGKMKLNFTSRSFQNNIQSRLSNDLTITVRKPPKEGRPVGYRMGDTGRYELSATVTPRRARVGDSVMVEVRLSGTGALPGSLKLPERVGVEWLTPEKHESMSVDNGKIAGLRTFRYAVRMGRAGDVDLGAVALPHYDPAARKYHLASVDLGIIQVASGAAKPGAVGDAGAPEAASDDDDVFASVAAARPQLRAYQAAAGSGFAPLWLWSLVLLPPLLVIGGHAAWRGAGGLAALRRRRAVDPAVMARRTLRQLNGKAAAEDNAARVERAVHYAVDAATGMKSRALMLGELADKLVEAGLSPSLAEEISALLRDCESLRFNVDADGGKANGLPARARALVKALLKAKKG